MSILTTQSLGQSFGDIDVFAGITVSVAPDARIGLVGPNGIGKTTLLRIMAGRASASHGRVDTARGARIGYLPQEAAHSFGAGEQSVYAELLSVFDDLRADEAKLQAVEAEISKGKSPEELIERYGQMQTRFELAGGYEYPLRIRRVLSGLGFDEGSWQQPIQQLSGGQKTRLLLGRLLLESPDLLIMDEPTNHLDVETVEWLEGMLVGWPGALLVVSHDRYFLDRVANTIWEMDRGGIESYRGNYSNYVAQREVRWDLRRRVYDDMLARFEKELDYIRRHIEGQRTQMAQGKLKRLSREVEAVRAGGLAVLDQIRSKGWMQATAGLDMERPSDRPNEVGRRISGIRAPKSAPPEFNLRFASAPRGGDFVLRSRDLAIGYDGEALFRAEDIELERGQRAALIGGNGTGKTSFLRTMLGDFEPVSGTVGLGGGLVIGYFSQAHDNLNPSDTVLEAITAEAGLQGGEARSYLGSFLFSGDDVFKPVSTLSGGERGRLALAILARRGANLLLLDEPTNHLDIPAQEMLEAVLDQFDGTVLMVSHDRYLVSRLATQVWEVKDDRLEVYPLGYSEYLAAREGGAALVAKTKPGQMRVDARAPRSDGETTSAATEGTLAAANGRPSLSKNERLRREREASEIEASIDAIEQRMAGIEDALQVASEAGDHDEVQSLGADYQAAQAEIDALFLRWEAISAELG